MNEISAEAYIPFDATLAAAEDASIIREALSRLSSDQRTALVMWEMEGRSTEEIATAIGTTPANVRHVVGRARTSFVRVLTEWVIDEENGTTALEALSSTYKKAAELAQKSSKAALSLIVLVIAFFGFNSVTGNDVAKVSTAVISHPNTTSDLPTPTASTPAAVTHSSSSSPSASATPSHSNVVTPPKKSASQVQTVDAKIAALAFAGLGKDGIPTGFTATDTQGHLGKIIVGKSAPVLTADGLVLRSTSMSLDANAVNVLLDQTFSVTGAGTTYSVNASVTIDHSWTPLNLSATTTDIQRLDDGNYLVTATMIVDSFVDSGMVIPAGQGIDVTSAPSQITTRIVLNPTKSQILAQAIQVSLKGAN